MKYNQVYGEYSLGTGAWLEESLFILGKSDVYNKKIIDSYVKQVSKDLNRISVKKHISNYTVMDVGTGRQALALYKLGAKKVYHFDISKTNIKNFNSYITQNNIPIISRLADISDSKFKKKELFDFIYLQGIIQHVKDPYTTIKNLSIASKNNAKIWFYNYQAGAIINLYAEAFRKILSNDINYYMLASKLKSNNFSIKAIDAIMDDCGCTYRNLIANDSYKVTFEKFGFRRYFTKDVAIQDKGLDLKTKRATCISAYIKSHPYDDSNKIKAEDLSHIDHFNPNNFLLEYRDFINKVRKIIEEIINIKKFLSLDQERLINICMPFFEGIINFDRNNYLNQNKIILLNRFENALIIAKNLK